MYKNTQTKMVLPGINYELLQCLNMLVLTAFIPISENFSLCLLHHCRTFHNEIWYCYCTLKNVFTQRVLCCICLSPKSPHLRLHSLLTVCLWISGNTCHMSWKATVQLFLEASMKVLLRNPLDLVFVTTDVKLMQSFLLLCWAQLRPPAWRCNAVIVSGGESSLRHWVCLSRQPRLVDLYVQKCDHLPKKHIRCGSGCVYVCFLVELFCISINYIHKQNNL